MKVEEARDLFNAVDTDKNGLLDFKELVTFLTSVFEASPFLPAGVTPASVAEATARACLAEKGVALRRNNTDNSAVEDRHLDFPRFLDWVNSGGLISAHNPINATRAAAGSSGVASLAAPPNLPPRPSTAVPGKRNSWTAQGVSHRHNNMIGASGGSPSGGNKTASAASQQLFAISTLRTRLSFLRNALPFGDLSPRDAFYVLANLAGEDGFLDRRAFEAFFTASADEEEKKEKTQAEAGGGSEDEAGAAGSHARGSGKPISNEKAATLKAALGGGNAFFLSLGSAVIASTTIADDALTRSLANKDGCESVLAGIEHDQDAWKAAVTAFQQRLWDVLAKRSDGEDDDTMQDVDIEDDTRRVDFSPIGAALSLFTSANAGSGGGSATTPEVAVSRTLWRLFDTYGSTGLTKSEFKKALGPILALCIDICPYGTAATLERAGASVPEALSALQRTPATSLADADDALLLAAVTEASGRVSPASSSASSAASSSGYKHAAKKLVSSLEPAAIRVVADDCAGALADTVWSSTSTSSEATLSLNDFLSWASSPSAGGFLGILFSEPTTPSAASSPLPSGTVLATSSASGRAAIMAAQSAARAAEEEVDLAELHQRLLQAAEAIRGQQSSFNPASFAASSTVGSQKQQATSTATASGGGDRPLVGIKRVRSWGGDTELSEGPNGGDDAVTAGGSAAGGDDSVNASTSSSAGYGSAEKSKSRGNPHPSSRKRMETARARGEEEEEQSGLIAAFTAPPPSADPLSALFTFEPRAVLPSSSGHGGHAHHQHHHEGAGGGSGSGSSHFRRSGSRSRSASITRAPGVAPTPPTPVEVWPRNAAFPPLAPSAPATGDVVGPSTGAAATASAPRSLAAAPPSAPPSGAGPDASSGRGLPRQLSIGHGVPLAIPATAPPATTPVATPANNNGGGGLASAGSGGGGVGGFRVAPQPYNHPHHHHLFDQNQHPAPFLPGPPHYVHQYPGYQHHAHPAHGQPGHHHHPFEQNPHPAPFMAPPPHYSIPGTWHPSALPPTIFMAQAPANPLSPQLALLKTVPVTTAMRFFKESALKYHPEEAAAAASAANELSTAVESSADSALPGTFRISQRAFSAALAAVLKHAASSANHQQPPASSQVLLPPAAATLFFSALDTDHSGSVSLSQVAAALSVVCAGDPIVRIRQTFNSFDADGNGYIDRKEARSFLLNVFRTQFATDLQMQASNTAMGITPEILAIQTADSLFSAADEDHDDRISLEEFTTFMLDTQAGLTHVSPANASAAGPVNASAPPLTRIAQTMAIEGQSGLRLFRHYFALHRVPCRELNAVFARLADRKGWIHRRSYESAMMLFVRPEFVASGGIMPENGASAEDFHVPQASSIKPANANDATSPPIYPAGEEVVLKQESYGIIHTLLTRVFDAFREEKPTESARNEGEEALANKVRFSALTPALHTLSGGATSDKVDSAFEVIDLDGDGVISRPELAKFLSALLRLSRALSGIDGTTAATAVPASSEIVEAAALLLAEDVFAFADKDHNGTIDKEELAAWYASSNTGSQPGNAGMAVMPSVPFNSPTASAASASAAVVPVGQLGAGEAVRTAMSVGLMRQPSSRDMTSASSSSAGPAGGRRNSLGMPSDKATKASALLHEMVDMTAISSLSLEHVVRVFAEYATPLEDEEYENDDLLEEDEQAKTYVIETSGILAGLLDLQAIYAGDRELPTSPSLAASAVIARGAGAGADADESEEEQLAASPARKSPQSRPSFVVSPKQRQAMMLKLSQAATLLASLFNEKSLQDRRRAIQIAQGMRSEEDDEDSDEEEELAVDFASLMAGFSSLCGSGDATSFRPAGEESPSSPDGPEVKAAQVFALFDRDGSGSISPRELARALASVYTLQYAFMPSAASSSSLSPSDLAIATTRQCFAECDVNQDGKLSFKEFKSWFLGPSANEDEDEDENTPVLSREALARYTMLPSAPAKELVIRILTAAAKSNLQGTVKIHTGPHSSVEALCSTISRFDFLLAMQPVILSASDPSSSHDSGSLSVLSALFDAYVVNRAARASAATSSSAESTASDEANAALSDLADANALSVAVTLLSDSGYPLEKAALTFSLFDTDSSGCISYEEAVVYVSAVLTMRKHVDGEQFSEPTGYIAAATASSIFAEADTDRSGEVDRDEFFAWTLGSNYKAANGDEEKSEKEVEASASSGASTSILSRAAVARFTKLPNTPAKELVIRILKAAAKSNLRGTVKIHTGPHSSVEAPCSTISRFDFLSAVQPAVLSSSLGSTSGQDMADISVAVLSALFDTYLVKKAPRPASAAASASAEADAALSDLADANALSVAVTLLSDSGSPLEKAALTFSLFDTDSSGSISYEEAVVYVSAVLTMRKHVDGEQFSEPTGYIAAATASSIFAEADTDKNGEVDREEWLTYSLGREYLESELLRRAAAAGAAASQQADGAHSASSAGVLALSDALTRAVSLATFRHVAALSYNAPYAVLDVLAENAKEQDGFISREGFVNAVIALRRKAAAEVAEMDAPATAADLRRPLRTAELKLIHAVFSLYVKAATGSSTGGEADFVSVAAPLATFSGGSSTPFECVGAALSCYDPHESGIIHPNDAALYLATTFSFLGLLEPDLLRAVAIVEASEDEEDEEEQQEAAELLGGAGGSSGASVDSSIIQELELRAAIEQQEEDDEREGREKEDASGAEQRELRTLLKVSGPAAQVRSLHAAKLARSLLLRSLPTCAAVVSIQRDDEDEEEEQQEAGQQKEKALGLQKHALAMWLVTRLGLGEAMETQAARVRGKLLPATRAIAQAESQSNSPLNSARRTTATNAAAPSAAATANTSSWLSMAYASSLLGFDTITPRGLLEIIAEVSEEDGTITYDAWSALIDQLSDPSPFSSAAPANESPELRRQRAEILKRRLFAVFEAEKGSGEADAAELCAGLCLLVKGKRTDRIRAAFTALGIGETIGEGEDNNNKERFVSLSDLTEYFCCAFRALQAAEPSSLDHGGNGNGDIPSEPDSLAEQAALQLFAMQVNDIRVIKKTPASPLLPSQQQRVLPLESVMETFAEEDEEDDEAFGGRRAEDEEEDEDDDDEDGYEEDDESEEEEGEDKDQVGPEILAAQKKKAAVASPAPAPPPAPVAPAPARAPVRSLSRQYSLGSAIYTAPNQMGANAPSSAPSSPQKASPAPVVAASGSSASKAATIASPAKSPAVTASAARGSPAAVPPRSPIAASSPGASSNSAELWKRIIRRIGLDRLPLMRLFDVFMSLSVPASSVDLSIAAAMEGDGAGASASARVGNSDDDEEKVLDSIAFVKACRMLEKEAHEEAKRAAGRGDEDLSEEEEAALFTSLGMEPFSVEDFARICARLFVLLDVNKDGVVSFGELVSGLMVLLPDADPSERMALSFSSFDINGDEFLSHEELTSYLHAVYTVSSRIGLPLPTIEGDDSTSNADPAVVAAKMAEQAFKDVGVPLDRGITIGDFALVFIGELPNEK